MKNKLFFIILLLVFFQSCCKDPGCDDQLDSRILFKVEDPLAGSNYDVFLFDSFLNKNIDSIMNTNFFNNLSFIKLYPLITSVNTDRINDFTLSIVTNSKSYDIKFISYDFYQFRKDCSPCKIELLYSNDEKYIHVLENIKFEYNDILYNVLDTLLLN